MREYGLSAKARLHRTRTTDSHHEHPVAPNLLNRDGTRKCAQYQGGGRYHRGMDMGGLALSRGVYEFVVGKRGKKEYPHLYTKQSQNSEETQGWKRMSRSKVH
jgi:hypothetical protein